VIIELNDNLINGSTCPCSEKIRDALKYQEEFVAESMEEVEEFCDNHSWLAEINEFVSTWDVSQVEYWKGQPTSNIEVSLVF
jgi:hypothetical protein